MDTSMPDYSHLTEEELAWETKKSFIWFGVLSCMALILSWKDIYG